MIKSRDFKGELSLTMSAFLWSFAPVFLILTFSKIQPLYTAALSTLAAAIFFALMVTICRQWHEIRITNAWKDILLTTLMNGVLFYMLLFIGTSKTTAGNAGIVMQMEVFFSMFILGLWKKEKMVFKHKIGAVLMIIGASIILFPGHLNINQGDLIILIATAFPPIGNYFTQKARKKVGPNMIMFIRSVIAGLFILLFASIFETAPSYFALSNSVFLIFINGIFLFGLPKIFWIEAIHRIPITKAISLSSVSPAFTLIFAYFILGEIPTAWQLLGLIPIIAGILFLTEYRLMNKLKQKNILDP